MVQPTSLAVRENWLGRATSWTLRALRLAQAVERPEEFSAGSDYARGYAVEPTYDLEHALSAAPANAWLAACVLAIAQDLSGLPIRVSRVGDRRDVLAVHPILDLLAHPQGEMSSETWRQQVYTDRVLTGNVFLLILTGSRGAPLGLSRMHPGRVKIVPSKPGVPGGFVYRGLGEEVMYASSAVVHIRGPSWESGPESLYGIGAVQPLDADLTADIEFAKAGARAASKGRPDAIYRPASDKVTWSPPQVRDMTAALDRMLSDRAGGVAVMSGHGQVDVLGWRPDEMQGAAQRSFIRQQVMALLDVPPARMGLETANYATAREQMAGYWQGLRGRAAAFDAALTTVAAQFPGPAVEVWHDFSGVPALREAQGAALQRVTGHIKNGMDPVRAYVYEGFSEVDIEWFVPVESQQTEQAQASLRRAADVLLATGSDTDRAVDALCDVSDAIDFAAESMARRST